MLDCEKIDPQAIRDDMLTVVTYVNQAMGVDYSDMVLVVLHIVTKGKSIGSYFSTFIASKIMVKASIIFMGFVSIKQIIVNKIGGFFGGLLNSYMNNSQEIIDCLSPCLIIHGKQVRTYN